MWISTLAGGATLVHGITDLAGGVVVVAAGGARLASINLSVGRLNWSSNGGSREGKDNGGELHLD